MTHTTCGSYYNEPCDYCDGKREEMKETERRETQRDIRQMITLAVVLVITLAIGVVWQASKAEASVTNPFIHFNELWQPLPTDVIDVLRESGRRDADTRRWERCVIRWGRDSTPIVCPGGYITHY